MVLSVISHPTCVVAKFNAIVKIYRYKGLHEGHHFIPEVLTHLGMIWIVSSRSVVVFSMIVDREVIYPYFFAFNFSDNVLVLLFSVF